MSKFIDREEWIGRIKYLFEKEWRDFKNQTKIFYMQLFIISVLLTVSFLNILTVITSSSMEKSVFTGDVLLLDVSDEKTPQRGEIIVFYPPPASGFNKRFLKRCAAVGGDTGAGHEDDVAAGSRPGADRIEGGPVDGRHRTPMRLAAPK